MAEFGLQESFHIDDDSLDGLSPQECFVLGVEWQKFYQLALNYQAGITPPVRSELLHAANLSRVSKLLDKYQVPYAVAATHDDWVEILFECGDAAP